MTYVALPNPKKNGLSTTIAAPGIGAGDATIPVTECAVFYDDAAGLILEGIVISRNNAVETATEEIKITGCSAASGAGNLTGVTRGVSADGSNGAAAAWIAGTLISVGFTSTLMKRIKDNFADHESNKAPKVISDYFTLYPIGASVPSSNTATPPVDRYETTTNKINQVYGVFTDGGTETLQWSHVFPNDWNGDDATLGKIIAQFGWTALSGSGTVKWVLKGKILPNDAALDTAFAAIGDATDTLITAEDQHLSPATTGAVISPVASGGKKVVFEVSRDSANDTLNATALLLEVPIQFIRTLAA